MTLTAGTRLGPYEIVSPLGAGGMGEVYRARDTRLEREVAVKVIPAHLAGEADALARFEREARAVAALSHPNILAIHDYGRDGSVSYAVMELLEGETLRERLGASALPTRKSIEYTQQIARGLAAAHDRGIVHRDLKPENVFLTRDGLVKILDFGLAHPTEVTVSVAADAGDTETGMVVGTPGFMSPEQIRGRIVDPRSDLFALGAILYEMLTGRRAFQGSSPVETMMAVLQDDPSFSGSGRVVPPELAPIVKHLLEKNPEDRFESARDLAFALQVVERELEISGRGAVSGPQAAEADAPSIAVLPFRNMSADSSAEYFSDGMTEEIINALTGIGPLRVAARTSSFAFKGKDTDIRQIGRELGVRCVLEGSIRQSGQQLRVMAQLIDVSSGYHLWSERYDREMRDIFAVQDEIARAIAEKLQVRLVGEADAKVIARPTQDLAAYDAYLKGRYDWNLRLMRSAVSHFQAAVERDPDYAAAHLALADSYSIWGFYGGIPCWEAFARARTAVESAARIAPDSPEVALSFGIIDHYYGWDTEREERELRRAIAGSPRSADAWFWLALLLAVVGRSDEALEAGRRGVALDPHSANAQACLAWAWAGQRRFEEAEPELEKAVALDPAAAFPLWSLAYAQQETGKVKAAITTLEHAVAVTDRQHFFQIALLGRALAADGRETEARRLLAELNDRAGREYVPPYDLAVLHAGLGERSEALSALERAFEQRNGLLWYRIHMPTFDALRDEPRFRAIADRLARTAPLQRPGGLA
jgi:eukaryotic-like serine/threonine-protein kinase